MNKDIESRVLDDPGVKLRRAVERHVALVTRLEHLASLQNPVPPRSDLVSPACTTVVSIGDVVLFRHAGLWRYGVTTETCLNGKPALLRMAYLPSTALDRAQRVWISRSRELLSADYPEREAARAREQYASDATAAHHAAQLAYCNAVMAQAVAARCTRQPWAAIVPVRSIDNFTKGLLRPINQDICVPPDTSPRVP